MGPPEIIYKELPPSVLRKPLEYPGLPQEVVVTSGANSCLTKAVLDLLQTYTAANATVLEIGSTSDAGMEELMQGKDAVLHVGLPKADATSEELNRFLQQTEALLHAASSAKVKSFVYASVASVVFTGSDLRAAGADLPPASPCIDAHTAALSAAEQRVAAFNGRGGALATAVVRHHNLYGTRDADLLPALAQHAREARMQVVGGGDNVVDFSYAGNVAHAHLLAARALAAGGGGAAAALAGCAVVATDAEPVPYRQFVGEVLEGLGYGSEAATSVPYAVAFCLALFFHAVAFIFGSAVALRPRLTLGRLKSLTRFQYYSGAAAHELLGYQPPWSRAEALQITLQSADARALRNPAARVRPVGPFSAAEVARHRTADDAWIIVDGKVYAVTPYLEQHPGGDAILNNAGGDSSAGFHGPQHPAQAAEVLQEFYVGDLLEE
eukprot:TRINITY_DN3897_c0_g1_i1.p1 TRINITY_DN3897_c0_g1~~TRINITY_DN3897_c0_g1_i1.p1  ORF type:complete len:439 (+),score=173.96 TRINITY_DN3897_c0_g1_i1:705-2021(+)